MLRAKLNSSCKYFYEFLIPRHYSNKAIKIIKVEEKDDDECICPPQVIVELPPPDCPVPEKKPPPPIDVCLPKIKKKIVLIPDCPEPCEPPPGPIIPLCRLKKKLLIFPKIKCRTGPKCPERSDADVVYKRKQLPPLKANKCPCIEDYPLKDGPPLKRLRKPPQIVQTFCYLEENQCPPRADDGLKITEKILPCLKPGYCPCIEPYVHDVPPLKRLIPKKVIPKPIICKKVEVCAEDEREEPVIVRKRLPCLKPSLCPCIEEPPPKDVCPLPRLPKVLVCPPPIPARCEEDKCPPRADEICGYKVEDKTLPTMILCEALNKVSISQYNAKKAFAAENKEQLQK